MDKGPAIPGWAKYVIEDGEVFLTMTAEEWRKTSKDYKGKDSKGRKSTLAMSQYGTISFPVKIIK